MCHSTAGGLFGVGRFLHCNFWLVGRFPTTVRGLYTQYKDFLVKGGMANLQYKELRPDVVATQRFSEVSHLIIGEGVEFDYVCI